jgi:hypothetical protein
MKERKVDLWDAPAVIVITTNGTVKINGEAVMGRGCAAEAKELFPKLPKLLGQKIKSEGNHVHLLRYSIVSFPVKHAWWEKADLLLIQRSARELVQKANAYGWRDIWIVRPGCGNGGLQWEHVKPVIKSILDDRFTVVHK